MDQSKPISSNSTGPSTPLLHVPRLSIAYFLAWTAVTAVLMAIFMLLFSRNQQPVDAGEAVFRAVGISILGWLVLGTLLIGWHKVRGTLWPLAPGEWLILAAGITVVSMVTAAGICESLFPYPPYDPKFSSNIQAFQQHIQQVAAMGRWRTPLLLLALICAAGGYGTAAFTNRRRGAWAMPMGAGAAMFLLFAGQVLWDTFYFRPLFQLLVYVAGGVALLAIVPLVTAVLVDRRRRVPRHWLHWSGVMLTGAALLLFGCTMITIFILNS